MSPVPKDAYPEEAAPLTLEERHQAAEAIVAGFPSPPRVLGGDKAAYYPGPDKITIPPKAVFDDLDEYYSTLFHELVHSTAHPSRLKRDCDYRFGSHSHGREELVAEMGSAFLTAECRHRVDCGEFGGLPAELDHDDSGGRAGGGGGGRRRAEGRRSHPGPGGGSGRGVVDRAGDRAGAGGLTPDPGGVFRSAKDNSYG